MGPVERPVRRSPNDEVDAVEESRNNLKPRQPAVQKGRRRGDKRLKTMKLHDKADAPVAQCQFEPQQVAV